MRNFNLVTQSVDVAPLLNAVMRQPELWDQNTLRTVHPSSPHTQVSDIWLRFNEVTANSADVVDDYESVNYPAMFALPQARPIIYSLMALVEGERLGRVLITRLPPGGEIPLHADGGSPAEYYDRYQIPLQVAPGVEFHAGDEAVFMSPGEIWWFNNSKEHKVVNNSRFDRISMIVDIRTFR
jgi:hypothetical protein